jgi:hypothetical protein
MMAAEAAMSLHLANEPAVAEDKDAPPPGAPLRAHLLAGVAAGQFAGLVMASAIMLGFAGVVGTSALLPFQVVGSLVFGQAAMVHEAHLPAFLAGLAIHQLGPSLAWGLVMGAGSYAMRAVRGTQVLILGLGIGIAAQVIDVNFALGMAYQVAGIRDIWLQNAPSLWSWLAHFLFGVVLALSYPLAWKRFGSPA